MNKCELDPKVKAKWCKALRSGKYKQGKKALKRGGKFCCLGVARDLNLPNADKTPRDELLLEDFLPADVQLELVDMNDGAISDSKSFSEIADWIEENL